MLNKAEKELSAAKAELDRASVEYISTPMFSKASTKARKRLELAQERVRVARISVGMVSMAEALQKAKVEDYL